MIVQKNLKIDFAQRGLCQQVFVVQGDCLSRGITFSLYENGTPWELPSGVTPALRYGKSDGTGGVYDTLPDGNAAWTAEGNEVGMLLAPQVMSAPGLVQCQLMLVKEDAILGSFSFHLIVEPDPAYDAVESKGYFNWSKVVGNLIMAPQAEVGQIIRVKTVDADGNPTEWEAVDFLESSQNTTQAVPSYWLEYLEGKLPTIREKIVEGGANTDMFLYFTDHHIGCKGVWVNADNTGHIIDFVREYTPVQNCFFGGDILNTTANQTHEQAMRWLWEFHDGYIRRGVYPVIGNHEIKTQYDTGGNHITFDEAYAVLFRDVEKQADTGKKMYYFVDNPSQKIRYIVLDTESETIGSNTAQLQWFVDVLGSMEEGWTAVLFAHHFSLVNAYDTPDNPVITQIAGDYRNRASGTSGAVAWDFADAVGEVACLICGHKHQDGSGINNGILVIHVTTDCGASVDNAANDNASGANRKAGDISEQAVDLFFINTEEKTVKTIRFGYGNDRVWSYGSDSGVLPPDEEQADVVNLVENADVAVGSPGSVTGGRNINYYTESGYSRATLNPMCFYAEAGSTLNASLSDYSVYKICVRLFSCDETAKDIDFSFVEGTTKDFGIPGTQIYNSGLQTQDISAEIEDTSLISFIFGRNDDAALTAADNSAIKSLLTVTLTMPTA